MTWKEKNPSKDVDKVHHISDDIEVKGTLRTLKRKVHTNETLLYIPFVLRDF